MTKVSSIKCDDPSATTDVAFHEIESENLKADSETVKITDFRNLLAVQTVKHWSQWSSVAGFIPVMVLDTAAISGLQIKMIYDLCDVYGVPFKKETAKSVISGLLGASATSVVSSGLSNTLIRHIPYIGTSLALFSQPVLAYASTYALGMVFIRHFETEGTLANFALESARGFYVDQLAKIKSGLKTGKSLVRQSAPKGEGAQA